MINRRVFAIENSRTILVYLQNDIKFRLNIRNILFKRLKHAKQVPLHIFAEQIARNLSKLTFNLKYLSAYVHNLTSKYLLRLDKSIKYIIIY